MEEIKFNYKIDIDEYRKVGIYLYKGYFLNNQFILVAILILSLHFFKNYNSDDKTEYLDSLYYLLILIPLFIILFYLFAKITIRRTSLKNQKIKEVIYYTLNYDYIEEKGQSFEIKHFWKDNYKVKETKNWYLIYLRKHYAIPLFKDQMSDQTKLDLDIFFKKVKVNKIVLK